MSVVELDPKGIPNAPKTSTPRGLLEIPDPISMVGWKEVAIDQSEQKLLCLNDFTKWYPIRISPQYYLQGIKGATPEVYLREEATARLLAASETLPKGYSLIVFDGYRPLEVQSSLFNAFKEHLMNKNPDIDEDKAVEMTQTYVSLPSSNPLRPSPHVTGGAIDLSINDDAGNLLPMGVEFDSFEVLAQTAYFKYISGGELYHFNRRLLYTVMTSAGFTNYPEEWWHYDYGNQFWGHILKKGAIYSLAKGGD